MKLEASDINKYHAASKMIEADGVEAYYTACERFGKELATAMLIMYLRDQFNPKQLWPAPEGIEEKINELLREKGIYPSEQF